MLKNIRYKLNLKIEDVEDAEKAIRRLFTNSFDLTVKFLEEMPTGAGRFSARENTVSIGIKDITKNDIFKPASKKTLTIPEIRKNKAKVSDNVFVMLVSAAFHEMRHCAQREEYKQEKPVSIMEELESIQAVANIYNEFYYHQNYSNNIAEVDAEQYGFEEGLMFTKKMYPEKEREIEDAFVVVFNFKASLERHWLHPEWEKGAFHSVEEISNAFLSAKQRLCDREYAVKHWFSPTALSFSADGEIGEISQIVYETERLAEENKGWGQLYSDLISSRGHDADKKLAAISCYFAPELKDQFRCLNNVPLDIKNVFGYEPKPIEREEKTEQSTSEIERAPLDLLLKQAGLKRSKSAKNAFQTRAETSPETPELTI